tara:strand:- start:82 stop:612 length:531 start_codon:yes stop_codon:yes gene_type:complete
MSGWKLFMSNILKNWFLLQFKPNAHKLAERNLHRQGFETFLPLQEITGRKKTSFINNLKPLFPGYMFVAFDIQDAPWRKINNTMGVSKLVSFNSYPKPVPIDLVSGLILRCDVSGKLLPPKQLNKGDEVQFLNGPFANFITTIEEIDAQQRIWVLMKFMGQSTRISVNIEGLKITK